MKVGFVQFDPTFGEKKRNCEAAERLLHGIRADVLVLPELFNTGYAFLNKEELAALSEPPKGETFAFVQNLARRSNSAIAYGFAERSENRFYNSMSFVAPSGLIATYRKSHLYFEEKFIFQPGDTGFDPVEYEGTKFGMLICWDWIYPEAMRTLVLKGAQIILHCANLVTPYCPDAMVTRAIENRVFIITADRVGDEMRDGKKFHFIGKSQVVAPNGDLLIRVAEETCTKVIEINAQLALNKKMNAYNDLFVDRRESLYNK